MNTHITDTINNSNFIDKNPVSDFSFDLFGYKPIAKEIASSILKIDPNEGYVLGINGKWGSGKSSLLFYIQEYLTSHQDELFLTNQNIEAIVFRFDPWLFSGHQDIINQFFIQLQAQLKLFPTTIGKKSMLVLYRFFEYGSKLRSVKTLEGQAAGWAFAGLHAITSSKIESSVISIFDLKKKIIDELPKIDNKIVIIIDDIDRLIPEEICELFRAIKSIGDFPNIVYILAYDEEIISSSLKSGHFFDSHNSSQVSTYGYKYLEKIVHFTVNIPAINNKQHQKVLEELLFGKVLKNTFPSLIDRDMWKRQYNGGIKKILNTPRSIFRLYNSLQLLYPSIENEVNAIDFIALEILREHFPSIYNLIRENHHFFIRDKSSISELFFRTNEENSLVDFHRTWRSDPQYRDHYNEITNIVCNLFPDVDNIFQEINKGPLSTTGRNPKNCNICLNYPTFLKYFRYQLEPDYFSNRELNYIINTIHNPVVFADLVHSMKSKSMKEGYSTKYFVDSLFSYIDVDVSKDIIENIIKGCFLLKNDIFITSEISHNSLYSYEDIYGSIARILYSALNLISREKRLDLLKESFSKGTNYPLMAELLIIIHQQNGDKNYNAEGIQIEAQRILNLDEVSPLEDIYFNQIIDLFSSDLSQFSSPNLNLIIYVINKIYPNSNKFQEIIDRFWEEEEMICKVIFLSKQSNYINPISLNSLEPYKSKIEFKNKIQKIMNQEKVKLSDLEKTILIELLEAKKFLPIE